MKIWDTYILYGGYGHAHKYFYGDNLISTVTTNCGSILLKNSFFHSFLPMKRECYSDMADGVALFKQIRTSKNSMIEIS